MVTPQKFYHCRSWRCRYYTRIAYEIIQMARLKGYSTGGTIHIVINNQIGFQLSDTRSSTYCTDVGKVTYHPLCKCR